MTALAYGGHIVFARQRSHILSTVETHRILKGNLTIQLHKSLRKTEEEERNIYRDILEDVGRFSFGIIFENHHNVLLVSV